MIFIYKRWDEFCQKLHNRNIHSVRIKDIFDDQNTYIVLKHDVETDVNKALKIAEIESKYGHKGTYYIQEYLLNNKKNIEILKKIQNLGHEVSYHYDVMDSCNGDLDKAIIEFEKNKNKFEKNGFFIKTVCQHGNPIIKRVGYTSNRDFFRSEKVKNIYPNISDVMVNFKERANTDYVYYSDAGRQFKMIFDPLFNDIINSEEKNIEYENLEVLLRDGKIGKKNCIISIHPHRWTNSKIDYYLRNILFQAIKRIVKQMVKIPIFNKIINRYYYLAKKF